MVNISSRSPSYRIYFGLFLLSAATLTFEISLIRIFSVAQFYHFAFLIVSIALLGYGASGAVLSILPDLPRLKFYPLRNLGRLSLAAGFSILFSYLVINWIPFDSFSIFIDRKQIAILILWYTVLALPFFFSGMAVGLLLSTFPRTAGRVYAANLIGSACGCVVALAVPASIGGEGTVLLCSGLTAIGSIVSLVPSPGTNSRLASGRGAKIISISSLVVLVTLLIAAAWTRIPGSVGGSILELNISPYKSLSYAVQYPGAEIIFQRWNSFSRVDVVRSKGIRSLPGLSILYRNQPPPEDGLLIDGDELNPIITGDKDLEVYHSLPSAIVFYLRPEAEALVLEPRGGLDILTAISLGAKHVTAVEVNPLIVSAAEQIYADPHIDIAIESDRSYTNRTSGNFDIVILSLVNSYHPVRSGAYSLAEDYRYTVEAFQDAIRQLNSEGILVVNRWLQNPPSESLRAFALAITALENEGIDPLKNIVVFRGYNMATLMVKKEPFNNSEIELINEFTTTRAFDMVYAYELIDNRVNHFSTLPEPVYWSTFSALLNSNPREDFYDSYQYDVRPPTDDKPFFGHYFKWSQFGEVIAELGKFWQPFGGAGYLIVIALLLLSTLLAGFFILIPVIASNFRLKRKNQKHKYQKNILLSLLIYFSMLGFGYLLVEIALIQKFILYLGQPAYAVTTVLFTLLLFSGVGSQFNQRIPLGIVLTTLVILIVSTPLLIPLLFEATIGMPLALRFAITTLALAPLGFLMGIPFPAGIQRLSSSGSEDSIPWVWAINGSASVISAVLAALLAISIGFNWVLLIGAFCYAAAWITIRLTAQKNVPVSLR
jgi:hypothetical protein